MVRVFRRPGKKFQKSFINHENFSWARGYPNYKNFWKFFWGRVDTLFLTFFLFLLFIWVRICIRFENEISRDENFSKLFLTNNYGFCLPRDFWTVTWSKWLCVGWTDMKLESWMNIVSRDPWDGTRILGRPTEPWLCHAEFRFGKF